MGVQKLFFTDLFGNFSMFAHLSGRVAIQIKNAETRMNTRFQHKRRRYETWTFQKKCSGLIPSFNMVEMTGIEPVSESISDGLSPSASSVLRFRLWKRPESGFSISYPVVPSCCRAFTWSFPVCLIPYIRPTGKPETIRTAFRLPYAAIAIGAKLLFFLAFIFKRPLLT